MSKTLKASKIWSNLSKDSLYPDTSYYLNVQNINGFDFYFLIKQPQGDLSFGIDYKYKSALPKVVYTLFLISNSPFLTCLRDGMIS